MGPRVRRRISPICTPGRRCTFRAPAGSGSTQLRDCCARKATGRLLHYGQGKWYPGEPLPRWSFSLYWRRDGQPIWRNEALIAPEVQARSTSTDVAHRFTERVAARLGITGEHILSAYEDPADRM